MEARHWEKEDETTYVQSAKGNSADHDRVQSSKLWRGGPQSVDVQASRCGGGIERRTLRSASPARGTGLSAWTEAEVFQLWVAAGTCRAKREPWEDRRVAP
jgi:hypothetical protein